MIERDGDYAYDLTLHGGEGRTSDQALLRQGIDDAGVGADVDAGAGSQRGDAHAPRSAARRALPGSLRHRDTDARRRKCMSWVRATRCSAAEGTDHNLVSTGVSASTARHGVGPTVGYRPEWFHHRPACTEGSWRHRPDGWASWRAPPAGSIVQLSLAPSLSRPRSRPRVRKTEGLWHPAAEWATPSDAAARSDRSPRMCSASCGSPLLEIAVQRGGEGRAGTRGEQFHALVRGSPPRPDIRPPQRRSQLLRSPGGRVLLRLPR